MGAIQQHYKLKEIVLKAILAGNDILMFSNNLETIGKFGMGGTGDGHLKAPAGLAVGINGQVIVADCDNHRVQIFS